MAVKGKTNTVRATEMYSTRKIISVPGPFSILIVFLSFFLKTSVMATIFVQFKLSYKGF